MDNLIEQGIGTPDGSARRAIHTQIQQLAIADCPSFTTDQYFGRHFERDWVAGWYYNPSYPGINFYNLWKWYHVPHALIDNSTQPTSSQVPFDVDYDGTVNMKDIGSVARSFGASYGPPLDPRWIFRCDVNNDRRIDMKDIGIVVKNFGKTSPKWTPT